MYHDQTDVIAEVFSCATGYSPRSAEVTQADFAKDTQPWHIVNRYKVTNPAGTWTVEEAFWVEDYCPGPCTYRVWPGDPADPAPENPRVFADPRR